MTTTTTQEPQPRRGEIEVPPGARWRPCSTCGASMALVRSVKGAYIPVSMATIEQRDGKQYALAHFVDCPDASKHRRKR